VAAGFDRFAPALIEHYLGGYAQQKLGLALHDLLALGRRDPDDASESFNMAYLAIRGSGAVNGVSRLHGKVSRQLFEPLFPQWPQDEVPVGHVTNGVYMPSWDSAPADDLWTEACGKDRWMGTVETLEHDIRRISDARLWKFRTDAGKSLIEYARQRLSLQLAASGASPEAVTEAKRLLDPNALTLGFARRFATYKRPNLLLHDPERLLRLLTDPERPVQLILAGKAHPADQAGQALIWEWTHFIRRPEARPHVIFLSDYDMLVTEHLVQGVDVWINTPRRPWEACGTSGMKVLVNGGINLSEVDGWWAEAAALYDLLEREVVPEFYNRNKEGIPTAWVARMRESMARLTPRFSANRAVCEYAEQLYVPAAMTYRKRAENRGAGGRQMVDWRHEVEQKWALIHFGEVKIETKGLQHVFEVQVYLNDLDPKAVRVELYADGVNGGGPVRQDMKLVARQQAVEDGGQVYSAQVPASRPAMDYTARVIPSYRGVAVPLEEAHILWQR
jgi:starch phosphorylase